VDKINEIRVYYNREKTKEVKNPIKFEPVKAGEPTTNSIFVLNNIEFPMGVGLQLIGEDINIKKNISSLKPNELKEVVLEFDPKIDKMQPIKGELIIDINYIVK